MDTSPQEQTGETAKQYKSYVGPNAAAAMTNTAPKFEKEEEVKATVDVGGDKRASVEFKVADSKWDGAQWKYQLRKADGELQGNGQWFLQSKLSFGKKKK